MSALYPVVPNVPGVPQVLRQAGQVYGTVSLLTSDAEELFGGQTNWQWGIYDATGQALITADTVFATEIRKDYDISDYPIEEGEFKSYNKVAQPFEGVVTFCISGSLAVVGDFKLSCLQAAKARDLVSIYTPELLFANANITGYRERRSQDQNTTLVMVEVPFREIRVAQKTKRNVQRSTTPPVPGGLPLASSNSAAGSLAAGQCQNPASADPVSAGTIQTDNKVTVTPLAPLTGPNINPVTVLHANTPQQVFTSPNQTIGPSSSGGRVGA